MVCGAAVDYMEVRCVDMRTRAAAEHVCLLPDLYGVLYASVCKRIHHFRKYVFRIRHISGSYTQNFVTDDHSDQQIATTKVALAIRKAADFRSKSVIGNFDTRSIHKLLLLRY